MPLPANPTHLSIPNLVFPSHVVFLHSILRLLVTAIDVPGSPVLVTLMMEVLHSSEFLTKTIWYNIPEDNILHSHRHENLKSYIEN
jgi:hypothetical protein